VKVNGAGAGYFEYHVPWPSDLKASDVEAATFRAELSAKQLFGKDKKGAGKQEGNFMLGKGTHDPSLNPNAYPMTDETTYASAVRVRIGGQVVGVFELPDDPADHRGILSWQAQKRDRTLTEAGSYGYLVTAQIPVSVLRRAAKTGTITVRLEVDDAVAGGLAIYGERFGRYPLDPTLAFVVK
jgi:predicted transcriptional regulator